MKSIRRKTAALLLVMIMAATLLPACSRPVAADSYLAIVPQVLHSGRAEAVSMTVRNGDRFVKDDIEVTLLKDNREVASARQEVDGTGTVIIEIPPDAVEGEYEITVAGTGFTDRAAVSIASSYLVFVETDKPIYKPGQTINIRVMTLDADLRPVAEPATVEVLDAKGIKVFREEVTTDAYGMAGVELPLSGEPNLGVWKINVITGKARSQLDVRVEEYVLPKYEVGVDLPREWFLVNEPIEGSITAEYSFGKPVSGELEIEAMRYVGQWETYATVTKKIDGTADFELPAVGYVAGTPADGGQGNVQLNVTVTEPATGYVEQTSRLLTVAQSPMNLELIPEGSVFKPGLPFSILIVTETPDNRPVEADVAVTVTYSDDEFDTIRTDKESLRTEKGRAILDINPPEDAIAMSIEAFELTPVSSAIPAQASKVLPASYSPSGNFIHLAQVGEGTAEVGQEVTFDVYATEEAANFYYEVIARGRVLFSDFTKDDTITFSATPEMAPVARLLVYQILPNSEVAADYLPFDVAAVYPQAVSAEFDRSEAAPAEEVTLNITTEGPAKVGIAAVDKSVFILAENRMNLQQVFDELERLYMEPQAEIHEVSFYPTATTRGAADIFESAGVVVMTDHEVPEGEEYRVEGGGSFLDKIARFFGAEEDMVMMEKGPGLGGVREVAPSAALEPAPSAAGNGGLAEVERVRQFFPETWLWFDTMTSADGSASERVTVPDSITTWMLRAVAVSPDKGLGIAESSLTVFQPFFLTIDLPYSAIRGEEFPVQVAVYNYLDTSHSVQVEIENSDWFDLLDNRTQTVVIDANEIGGASFTIRPTGIGTREIKITARSTAAADAAIKTIIIEPEGVAREIVDNLALAPGLTETIDTAIPENVVSDSGRAYIAVTSSFLTQTIDGLEGLLQMPFGCGEQNMIVFAPDVYITRYLQESGQIKPEIMAKAEKLMITGYQRELTYRHNDGSFSAFGMSDETGSLWLTAFVLKSFSQAQDLMYIDAAVLDDAAAWIIAHQNSDGSFDQVGFVHHQEMLGGLQGKDALTAYTAIALLEAGERTSGGRAVAYLEGKLDDMSDPYAVAITAYALELAESPRADAAYNKLISLAREDENGMYWGAAVIEPEPATGQERVIAPFEPDINRSASIETTAYATLALVKHGDAFNASKSSKWLVSKRNAYGGYGSTQDTVVTLQALTEYATGLRSDVDLTVTIEGAGIERQIQIDRSNFDVLQIIEVPVNAEIEIAVSGQGDAVGQVVRRFNEPAADTAPAARMLEIDVAYDTTEVEVNDLVGVAVDLEFNPLPELAIAEAGMIVLDVSVPTGFEPVAATISAVTERLENIKRYDIAGRKVIFYVENMEPGDRLSFEFQVKALYPVKAKGVTSTAYSYYKPDIKGETLSEAVTVK